MNKEELYCTKCGSNIEKQYGFYRNVNVWICKRCHTPLINPSYPNDIIWFCDSCNAILNNQDSWNPYLNGIYSCEECGYKNEVINKKSIDLKRRGLLI